MTTLLESLLALVCGLLLLVVGYQRIAMKEYRAELSRVMGWLRFQTYLSRTWYERALDAGWRPRSAAEEYIESELLMGDDDG